MALFNYYPYSNFHELNLDWIINIVKKYTEETDALEIKVDDFIAYVTNYLDNLDVQAEIDQKLEEMKENGELAELIAEFLQTTSLIVFKTKALMKSAENLADGITVLTDGTDAYNDGETRLYYIRNMTSSDVVDEVNLVSLANYPTLVAEWLKDNYSGVFDSIKGQMLDYVEDNLNYQPILEYVEDNIEFSSTTIKEFYVNDITGDDNNDGSYSHPFKTLNKTIEMVKKGYTSVLIKITNSNHYYIDEYSFSGFTWHMMGINQNTIPTVHFRNGCRIYDCHVNWQNMIIQCDDGSQPYQDSNYSVFKRINFIDGFRVNYGGFSLTDITAPQLVFSKAIGTLTNWTIFNNTPADANTLLSVNNGSSVVVGGTVNINYLTKDMNQFCALNQSAVLTWLVDTPNNNQSLHTITLGINMTGGAILLCSTERYTALGNIGANGNRQVAPSLKIHTAATL